MSRLCEVKYSRRLLATVRLPCTIKRESKQYQLFLIGCEVFGSLNNQQNIFNKNDFKCKWSLKKEYSMYGILDRWSFNNNNDNNNFIYIALISWAHGALQCKKGENEIIYISQAWNLFTGLKIIKFTKTMTHSLKIALKDMFSILS